jgi:hypothetical protein
LADLNFGYKYGDRVPVMLPLDSTSTAIVVGDMLTLATAGYYKKLAAGDIPYGVAMQQLDTADLPATDGLVSILADVSRTSVYRYPAGAGTLTVAMRGATCDTYTSQAIDATASTDDQIEIVAVDTVNNAALVRLLIPAVGGVV